MSRKKKDQKKTQQKNLPLKERLAKHWNNRNWDLFVALFLRDREASMRTPWASRWNDALYNSLTQALFVDKNPASAETTLAVINAERSAFQVEASLEDCADVASDFLRARKDAFLKELSPLRAEHLLPVAYVHLRRGLSSFLSSPKKAHKARKGDAAAAVEKFTAQYARLGRAKTVTPYTTWVKMAEQLESLAKGTGNEGTFRAISAITALVHELFRTGRGANSLREPESLRHSRLFTSIPHGQTHTTVKALWCFFCHVGAEKYGAEWGEAARVSQLSFMADENQRALRAAYQKLTQTSDRRNLPAVIPNLLRGSSAWTEQEQYVLNTVFVTLFSQNFAENTDFAVVKHFMGAFGVLAHIGSKWRPEAPWTKDVMESFKGMLFAFPSDVISMLLPDVPYRAVPPSALIVLSLLDGKHLKAIEKAVPDRLPLTFTEEDTAFLTAYLADAALPRRLMPILHALVDPAGCAAILRRLCRETIEASAEAASHGEPLSRQPWTEFSRNGLPEEMAASLPPDDAAGCFYRLCAGMPPHRISSEPAKVDAFFAALRSCKEDDPYADRFLALLATWPAIDPEFLVRLCEQSSLFRNKSNRIRGKLNRTKLVELIEWIKRIPNPSHRGMVAQGVLMLIAKDSGKKHEPSFKKAMAKLQDLADIAPHAETDSAPGRGIPKRIVRERTSQGLLPFEEE